MTVEIVPNQCGLITKIAETHLGAEMPEDTQSIGFAIDGTFIGAFLWFDFKGDGKKGFHSCQFAGVVLDNRMFNRNTLNIFYAYPFTVLSVSRLWALVDVNNDLSNKIVKQLGARKEGMLRQALTDNSDAYLWSILRDDLEKNKVYQWAKKADQKHHHHQTHMPQLMHS